MHTSASLGEMRSHGGSSPHQSGGARLLVFSYVFPSPAQPGAGLFVRERVFRVGKHLPMVVVAPQPWFPLQSLIRLFRPRFRPTAPRFEVQNGFEIHRPRFFCIPGIFKQSDGFFMALGAWPTVRRLVKRHSLNVIDAHFGYPDGYAATRIARWLGLPVVITMRGKEEPQSKTAVRAPLYSALRAADRVVCVSEALRAFAIAAGVSPEKTMVVGNGVDLAKFAPVARAEARREFGLAIDAPVLVSVGRLVEGKGFHRVIECLPALLRVFPDLQYLIVGSGGPEGDMSAALRAQAAAAGVAEHVRFLGQLPPERMKTAYSAADVFVLATSYEGWANVFLEAMACGLPVVTTRVGGNAQVVCRPELGTLVPFGDSAALTEAIAAALRKPWDREQIIEHARSNAWEKRVAVLLDLFSRLAQSRAVASAVRLIVKRSQ